MAECRWCGVPPPPARPLRCGVLVYFHIPKTGGSTVSQFLLRHSTGGRSWWQASVTPNSTWDAIATRLRRRARPKQIIIHHVDSPTAIINEALLRTVVRPLDCWLRSQGCRLVLTTTLREAEARAASAAYYNRVPHAGYATWVAEHARDAMVTFVLHNRVRLRKLPNRTAAQMGDLELQKALRLLSGFDAVGRTEEMHVFLGYLRALLGGVANAPAGQQGLASADRINDTPQQHKYELTAEERTWTARHTALDAQLYHSLCTRGAVHCALRTLGAQKRDSTGMLRCDEQPRRLMGSR